MLNDKDVILDNDNISTQLKKQLSKTERLLRSEFNNQFEEFESKITATRKAVDSRLHDFDALVDEKIQLIDKKIIESLSEKSYQFHERNVNMGIVNNLDKAEVSFQSRTIENKLKSIENRLSKFENKNNKDWEI